MSIQVSSELRSQIIASIKSGTSIMEAATTNNITPQTIRKWMRQLSSNTHPSTTEIQKARKQIEFLEHVILDLVLEQKSQTYKA